MCKTSKLARKARLSKQTKGNHKGEDTSRKSPCPHMQPKPTWAVSKSRKGKISKIKEILNDFRPITNTRSC
jgi:hypothetical protein